MKNITLSIEDDIIALARSYAQQHHTTLNQLVRDFLKQKVTVSTDEKGIERLFELADKYPSQLENYKFCREEIYDL
ncbi:MAG: hypothetical protein K2W97_08865 [Chthoniobacterales bacterium]|nr:hypothetical protein [Chthoniobacterales bacterium]